MGSSPGGRDVGPPASDPVRFRPCSCSCAWCRPTPGACLTGHPWMGEPAPVASRLRIVSLNLWGGQALGPLLDFVREQAAGTDLFCFQEMLDGPELVPLACGFRTTLFRETARLLPDFAGVFDPVVAWDQPTEDGRTIRVPFGLATFARRSLPILDRRAENIVEHQDNLDAVPGLHPITRWLQVTELR